MHVCIDWNCKEAVYVSIASSIATDACCHAGKSTGAPLCFWLPLTSNI